MPTIQTHRSRLTAFQQGLRELGWSDGRNIQSTIGVAGAMRPSFAGTAEELVALSPDVHVQ